MLCALRSFRVLPPQTKNFLLPNCIAAGINKISRNMSKRALVILSPGAEELEFTTQVDVLRRAGISVTIGGLKGADPVKCARDVCIVPDEALESVKDEKFDAIILPGGLAGSKAMSESSLLGEILQKQACEGRIIAAICAGPTALAAHNICPGLKLTSYPSVKDQLECVYKYIDGPNVVEDGILITSRGPATAMEFAFKICEHLAGCEKSQEVAKAMLFK